MDSGNLLVVLCWQVVLAAEDVVNLRGSRVLRWMDQLVHLLPDFWILGEAELLERRGTVLDRHFSAIEIVLICAIRLGDDEYRHVII